jgi:hypothetical protein
MRRPAGLQVPDQGQHRLAHECARLGIVLADDGVRVLGDAQQDAREPPFTTS